MQLSQHGATSRGGPLISRKIVFDQRRYAHAIIQNHQIVVPVSHPRGARIPDFATRPGIDFTRCRKFPADKLISFPVTQGASFTRVEMPDFFGMDDHMPTSSAFRRGRRHKHGGFITKRTHSDPAGQDIPKAQDRPFPPAKIFCL